MSISSTILESTRSSTPLAMLVNSGCKAVGGVFRLDYSRAVVLTDHWRKTQAGGVPHGAFHYSRPLVCKLPKASRSMTRN